MTKDSGEELVTQSELIERCRRGDRDAYRELYDQTSARIYRLLLRMTRNADDALDLAQDAYVRAWEGLGRFDGGSTFGTWLYRIAVNEALQFLRRKRPLRLKAEAELRDPTSDSQSDAQDLDEILARLEPSDRAILLLRYQEGLDYRAIALALDCPAGTVASRLNRARQRARELLSGTGGRLEENTAATHPTGGEVEREAGDAPADGIHLETGFP